MFGSLWAAYRVTGDEDYQEKAWNAFEGIRVHCRVGRGSGGYAGLQDVSRQDGGARVDVQESFGMAETLKYLYLIFKPEFDFQLRTEGRKRWVFNAEAHPLRIRGTSQDDD